MRVLVTGTSGMLGYHLMHYLTSVPGLTALSTARKNLGFKVHFDFDLVADDYEPLLNWSKPDCVIHCAAMTNVDECQKNPELAFKINTESSGKFLNAFKAKSYKTKFIFISSDAVKSDGQSMAEENCEPGPVNVYGETKLAAEKIILQRQERHVVVRTTIVGTKKPLGQSGFCDSILENADSNKRTPLFEDAWFTPISCQDLSPRLKFLIQNDASGLFHIAGSERVNKYEFGIKLLKHYAKNTSQAVPVKLKATTLLAQRILEQSLSSAKFTSVSGLVAPNIDQTIRTVFLNKVG